MKSPNSLSSKSLKRKSKRKERRLLLPKLHNLREEKLLRMKLGLMLVMMLNQSLPEKLSNLTRMEDLQLVMMINQ